MKEKEIDKLWNRRKKLFERLDEYHNIQNNFSNLRNFNSQIKRTVKKIHEINEVLYIVEKIDKRFYAL